MRLQFTLRRMLLSTTVFALVLGLLGTGGDGSVAGALAASTAVAGLVLLAKRKDITRLIYSVTCTGIGLFLAMILAPPVMQPGSFTNNDELYALIAGATAGWILGCVALRLDNRIKSRYMAGNHADSLAGAVKDSQRDKDGR